MERGSALGAGKVVMDSALSICVCERHVRSCTFPYCFTAGFFVTTVAVEVTRPFLGLDFKGFWIS